MTSILPAKGREVWFLFVDPSSAGRSTSLTSPPHPRGSAGFGWRGLLDSGRKGLIGPGIVLRLDSDLRIWLTMAILGIWTIARVQMALAHGGVSCRGAAPRHRPPTPGQIARKSLTPPAGRRHPAVARHSPRRPRQPHPVFCAGGATGCRRDCGRGRDSRRQGWRIPSMRCSYRISIGVGPF